ncbi:MAG: TauD/TfdA family dioxygenase [Rhodospirillaceae bacterium]|nr:TauD/TfdA family dioxygenase [Rhodospirillaceae bacterium]
MGIQISPLPGGIGAEIHGIDLKAPSHDDRRAIYQAYLDHRIIALRGQDGLTTDNVMDASRILGPELEPHVFTRYHHPDTPLLMVLSNRVDTAGNEKGLKDAGSFWHSDVSYKEIPAKATMLYALEVPDVGGNTLFCDMAAAYEGLPDAMKARLNGLQAVHNYAHTPREIFKTGEVTPPPDCVHPVIRTNPENGCKSIYINPSYTVRIKGMPIEESDALKDEIFAHCQNGAYCMSYGWRVGDVVAWDNAASMHAATTDKLDPTKHRTIWRTIISGEGKPA